MSNGPYDLSRQPIHLGDDQLAFALEDFAFDSPSFEDYVEQHTDEARPGRLMMIETSPASWSTWECHPHGAEIVHVLEGRGTFFQQNDDGTANAMAFEPGTTLINPPGVWHTADVDSPMRAIYITPCIGTSHKPRS